MTRLRPLSPFALLLALASIGAAACSSSTDAPSVDPAALARVQACVRLSGCVGFEPEFAGQPGGVSACSFALDDLALTGGAIASCALEAADCDAAAACLDAGAGPASCDPATEPSRCDGDVARICRAGVTMARDCAADGLSCLEDGAGQVFCGRPGGCTQSECDGNTLLWCINGEHLENDCGEGVCLAAEGLGGSAVCAGEGEPCEGPVFECDGDIAVTCRYGRIHREPCGPGLCSTSDGAFCMSDPSCFSPHCEGAVLVSCADGEPQRFDCAEWGYEGCVELADGGVRCE